MIGKILFFFFGISSCIVSILAFVLIDSSLGDRLQSMWIAFVGGILIGIGIEW